MNTSIGVNLRVTAHSNQGGREHMEDYFCLAYQPTSDDKDICYASFGVFDGHGGEQAASYVKNHLTDHIASDDNFWSEDDNLVLKSIKDGFVSVHENMKKELGKWPQTTSGFPSASGTTATVAFIRRGKLFIGHVGDSGIALGSQVPNSSFWGGRMLTKDHKPGDPDEMKRIIACGGKVQKRSRVSRVVWRRPVVWHEEPIPESIPFEEIPFLAVARSLGDFWSYKSDHDEYLISPVPDTAVIEIDPSQHRCLILASDGLWNVLNAQEAVNSVCYAETNNQKRKQEGSLGTPQQNNIINPSVRLVTRALDRFRNRQFRADNTTAIVIIFEPQTVSNEQRNSCSQEPNSSPPTIDLDVDSPNDSVMSEIDGIEIIQVDEISSSSNTSVAQNDLNGNNQQTTVEITETENRANITKQLPHSRRLTSVPDIAKTGKRTTRNSTANRSTHINVVKAKRRKISKTIMSCQDDQNEQLAIPLRNSRTVVRALTPENRNVSSNNSTGTTTAEKSPLRQLNTENQEPTVSSRSAVFSRIWPSKNKFWLTQSSGGILQPILPPLPFTETSNIPIANPINLRRSNRSSGKTEAQENKSSGTKRGHAPRSTATRKISGSPYRSSFGREIRSLRNGRFYVKRVKYD